MLIRVHHGKTRNNTENKAEKKLINMDEALSRSYLKTHGIKLGLLLNSGAPNFEIMWGGVFVTAQGRWHIKCHPT